MWQQIEDITRKPASHKISELESAVQCGMWEAGWAHSDRSQLS